MTSRCPGCAKEVDEKDAVCPHCGRDFSRAVPVPPASVLDPDAPLRREPPPRRGRFQTTEWEEAPAQAETAQCRAPRPWLTLAALLAGAFTLFIFGSWLWRRAHRSAAPAGEVVPGAEIEAAVDIDQRPMDILVDRQPAFPPPAHPGSPRSLDSAEKRDAPAED